MQYELKQATAADWDLIFEIKKKSIKPYVEKIFGWNEEQQRKILDKIYKIEQVKLIMIDGKAIGILQIEERPDVIFLANLLIAEEKQNKGIGKILLDEVIERANTLHKPVMLEVFRINERAQKFYLNSGFSFCGEKEHKFEMIHTAI